MDLGNIPDAVRAGLGFLSSVALLIGVALRFVDSGKSKRQAKMKAIPPSDPSPAAAPASNPFGHPPPTDPALLMRLDKLTENLRERWVEQDLRRALADASNAVAAKTRALVIERERRKKAETAVLGKESQIATLQGALDRTQAELELAQRELAAARAREQAALRAIPPPEMHEDTRATPLRPPRLVR